jgi:hypothetical protein
MQATLPKWLIWYGRFSPKLPIIYKLSGGYFYGLDFWQNLPKVQNKEK